MQRRPSAPKRPRALRRRRFTTHLSPSAIRQRLEERLPDTAGLPALFVLPAKGEAVRLSGPDLCGDLYFGIVAHAGTRDTAAAPRTEVTLDFRADDKTVAAAVIAAFGADLTEGKVSRPRQEVMGHSVPGHQPNVGHFLAWAARMPSMADHVILESAVDAGFSCDFDCFEHIHAAMRALDFMRMVRMEGGVGGACDGDEIPPHLRHPTRQGLRGRAAVRVVCGTSKLTLDATIDSKPDPRGHRLRLHYGWSSELRRYVIGWVSDLAPKA
ncbi:MAG: hypothetical protein RIS38_908 [Verrucomicrobiota bacterium]|jgi:hypothetical protein